MEILILVISLKFVTQQQHQAFFSNDTHGTYVANEAKFVKIKKFSKLMLDPQPSDSLLLMIFS